MNAICGILQRDNVPVQEERLRLLLQEPVRAGSDAPHTWCRGAAALGCSMQRITAESQNETLPYYDPQGKLAITADVRLDNREALCALLVVDPAQRRTIADSQLLLLAYRKWGLDCPTHLLGDFAFAIWDGEERRFFCARDILGVRPFYYHLIENYFVFASDMAALLAGGVPDELNLAYLSAHFRHGQSYPDERRTFYAAIRKLPPGQAMTVSAEQVQNWTWWDPIQVPDTRYPSDDAYAEQLLALLDESIRARLRTIFPVGGHVSGGLDCTTITILANRILKQEGKAVTGFSWSPVPGSDGVELRKDERELIAMLSQEEGFDVCYSAVTPQDFAQRRLRDIGRNNDVAFVHELFVRRLAAQKGIRVMLSGWGGDELITYHGQSHFSHLLLRGRWLALHRALKQQARNYRTPLRAAYRNWLIRPMLPDSVMFRLHPDSLAAMWDKKPLPTLFQPDFNAAFQGAELLPSKHVPRSRLGIRRQQLSLLAYGHLTYRIEGWAVAGARMGITYTYPLLDRRIVEFALGLPPDLYIRNGWQRYLFRYALGSVLPDELIWRKDKRDPSLDANRQQIGRSGRDALPLLLQDILADNRSYQILDGQQARDIVAAYDGLGEESEAAFDFANVLNSFIVELLVNPELGRAAQERIDAME